MKKVTFLLMVFLIALLAVLPVGAQGTDNPDACWGQASAVFAQTGEMGQHSSELPTPRMGLRNLARFLYENGAIPDDSLQALGQYVATELNLSIDACMT